MKFLFAIAALVVLNGCAAYSHTGKEFPDGFNLTDYHALGTPVKSDTIAMGFSWSLK